MINDKILYIAKLIRKNCFDFAMSNESQNNCFHENETLACMCAFASFVLYKSLLNNGFENVKFCQGYFWKKSLSCCHCWVEYNKQIIDLTATQFGNYKEIYITKTNNQKYDLTKYCTNIYDLNWDDCCINGFEKLVLDKIDVVEV